MQIFMKSDVGLVRHTNQDDCAVGYLPNGAWAVVCDGMGGVQGGNVASALAVDLISSQIASSYRPGMGGNSIRNMLEVAFDAANMSIFETSCDIDGLRGMGTTATVVVVEGDTAYIAHAGDSRAYLISKDAISQVTRDHSIVQEMVEAGELTQSQARTHPNKHMITRALGVVHEVEMDYCEVSVQDGDVLILCTDGLSNYLEADAILQAERKGLADLCDRLVREANNRGGSDNITVAVLALASLQE